MLEQISRQFAPNSPAVANMHTSFASHRMGSIDSIQSNQRSLKLSEFQIKYVLKMETQPYEQHCYDLSMPYSKDGFLDQYKTSFIMEEQKEDSRRSESLVVPAVPGGKRLDESQTSVSEELNVTVNQTQKSKNAPSFRYDKFQYAQEENDDSEDFKTRLQEFRERVNSNENNY